MKSKNILVIGNLGYVGSVLNEVLSNFGYNVFGIDPNWFGDKKHIYLQKKFIKKQWNEDIRKFVDNDELWKVNYDAVVYLAAVSNDPMGQRFSSSTKEINAFFCRDVAKKSKRVGVPKFIFASSCSMYGKAHDNYPSENDELSPLTEYAKSKVLAEKELSLLSDKQFKVISLRFATACGASSNLRLDLVLNDLVASAIINKKVEVLSDGTPWRPIVHVKDMSNAIKWSIDYIHNENFLAINIGSDEFTFQIRDLAKIVAKNISNADLSIATDKAIDARSYKVNFDLCKSVVSKEFQPKFFVEEAIQELAENVLRLDIPNNFREAYNFMRLKKLEYNIKIKKMDNNLFWI